MKKIVLIDESDRFREYIAEKLEDMGLDVIQAVNGLDGSLKLRSEIPDLVIMDYILTRKSSIELLEEKISNPNTRPVPVILTVGKADKTDKYELDQYNLPKLGKYSVKKIYTKPVRIDGYLKGISEILNLKISFDTSPCMIDIHYNGEIIFIEIAMGLNDEKTKILKYKIRKIIEINQIEHPKILMMMVDIKSDRNNQYKIKNLFEMLSENIKSEDDSVKLLTKNESIKSFVRSRAEYKNIEIFDNLNDAMDNMAGMRTDKFAHDKIIKWLLDDLGETYDDELHMKLETEEKKLAANALGFGIKLAIADGDLAVRDIVGKIFSSAEEREILNFDDGKKFMQAVPEKDFDLILLDLDLPGKNGFEILQYMKILGLETPVIILSSSPQKEQIMKAMNLGAKAYMMKPIDTNLFLKKVCELLRDKNKKAS